MKNERFVSYDKRGYGYELGVKDNKTGKKYNLYCKCANLLNEFDIENEQLKKELFEVRKKLLWATSDEVDRILYYEDEVEELRKEVFND